MKQPNIILIMMDATRADHLSCYGYQRQTSPNIDRIADEGVLYENAISPAVWTVPSHASLFTGMFPSGHGASGRRVKLRNDVPTLAEFFSDQGYTTLGLTCNSLVTHDTGLARGFHEFRVLRFLFDREHPSWWQRLANLLYVCIYWKKYDYGAWRLNLEMKGWIHQKLESRDVQRPFCIFANYLEPHLLYHPPRHYRNMFLTSGQRKRWRHVNQNAWRYMGGAVEMTEDNWEILIGLYDATLAYLDMRIGQIYDFLLENGILNDTILIITSDHGENLGEHNLMDHQYCVYDTLARVPLIIRYPVHFPPRTRISMQVQTLDIFPTLVDVLLNGDAPYITSLQGQSVLPERLEESPRDFTVIEYLAPQLHSFRRESLDFGSRFARQLRAIRTDKYKYIWASDGTHELYDLRVDPGENQNLIHMDSATAECMDRKLQQWVRDFSRQQNEDDLVDEAVVRRLKDLGYI